MFLRNKIPLLMRPLSLHFGVMRFFGVSLIMRNRVAILGAAGHIGQPLSLLLKHSKCVEELALYDISKALHGIAADISHLNTCVKVESYSSEGLIEAITGADVIVIAAGLPRSPGMSREDLFETNAKIVFKLTKIIACTTPNAIVAIVTNPVNSIVPLASAIFEAANVDAPRRLFGVTTLDVIRASTFVGECAQVNPEKLNIPVIGGHSANTIVPLISLSNPKVNLTADQIEYLTERIRNAGTEIVNAKAGEGSATLSMAFAAARFVNSLCKAKNANEKIVECAYIRSKRGSTKFLATPLVLGPRGWEEELEIINELSPYEEKLWCAAIEELEENITVGEQYAAKLIG